MKNRPEQMHNPEKPPVPDIPPLAGPYWLSLRRIYAMVLRYTYLMRSSWPRLIELAYWPVVQMVLWGFITLFLANNSTYIAQAFGVLLSGVLLWDILFRSQLGVSVSFLEEMWSRNLGHLFVSPLRPVEMMSALMVISFSRTLIGLAPAVLLAIPFYGFSLFSLGLPLIGFFFALSLMGWALGLAICGMILRLGLGAESLAWFLVFALSPISGIYYPISVLPDWLQPVAWCLPSAHVFEGMRSILIEGQFRADFMLQALMLDVVYLILGGAIFLICFHQARDRALLLQIGE